MEQSVPKRRHMKFRRRGIAQKKEYNIQNQEKVWNQNGCSFFSDKHKEGKHFCSRNVQCMSVTFSGKDGNHQALNG